MTRIFRLAVAGVVASVALGSLPSSAEAGEGAVSQSRARLEAEWSKARARDAANAGASFAERLFGLGDRRVAEAPATKVTTRTSAGTTTKTTK